MTERPTWADAFTNVLSGMAGQPPKRLLRAVEAFADEDLTEDDLVTFLKSVSVNDRAMIQLRISLGGWDAMPREDMGGDTEPNTEDRRVDVYKRLGLGGEAQDVLEDRAPAVVEDTTVISKVFDPWYHQSRHERPTMYWDHYAGLLRDVKEWPGESISSLDITTTRVVERLSDPRRLEAKQTKGLVVGYVQSGKTANFTGVIAKAVDAGYRLVIVLTGTIELLRAQTQRRLDMELVGRENLLQGLDPEDPKFLKEFDYTNDTDWVDEKFIQHGPALDQPGVPRIRRVTTRGSDYRRLPQGLSRLRFDLHDRSKKLNHPDNLAHSDAHIAIIKKNAAPLQKLIEDLRPIRKDLADLPVLIIDDESDQASPNTKDPKKSTKEERDRTRINKLISELLSMCPRAQYVGYTATPFANVFIDPDDERDLFPSDFLLSLQRPPEYMGVADFHDVGMRWDDETKTVANSNEMAHVRGLTGAPHDDPVRREVELREALDAFVLSGAIKAYREVMGGRRQRHHTMLVHESVRTADQLETAALVRSLWETGEYGASGLDRLAKLYSADFGPVMAVRADGQPVPKTFSELKPYIGNALSKIMRDQDPVLLINSDSEIQRQQKKLDFDADDVWRILVGGSKLSRGFTVEGLTISYFRRKALQADTLMQAGRWFGFRPGYRDLVRLYIRRDAQVDLYHAFEALLLDEESFRDELRRYEGMDEDGRPLVEPRHIPPMVSQHLPWLRPTARNKMWNAVLESKAPAGRLLDFFGHPGRTQHDAKQHNFAAVALPLLKATSPEHVTFSYQLNGPRGSGTFQGRLGTFSAKRMVELLEVMRWHPTYASSFRPVLRFIEEATQAGRIDEWAVVWPQPSKPWATAAVGGMGQIPLIKRSRRRDPRIDFVGSDAKHRQGAELIARGEAVGALPGSPARGVVLITVSPDVEQVIPSADLSYGDLVGLFSLAVPTAATPNRRDLVRWTVRSTERPEDPTVELKARG